MVFAHLAVYLLDKYLGDYIENLDSKQLKIDLWNGKSSHSLKSIVDLYFQAMLFSKIYL